MKRLLLSFVVVGFSTQAHAEIVTNPSDICLRAKHDVGAWLDEFALKRCLRSDLDIRNLQKTRDLLKDQVSVLARQVRELEKSRPRLIEERALWKDKAIKLEELNIGLKHDLKAWYRQPSSMIVGGVLIGVLSTTAVFFALASASGGI